MRVLELLRTRAGVSWLLLVVATLASWLVGAEHGTGSMVAVVVLAIAAVKIRLVGLDFMELRHAPTPLRVAFETYCVALWSGLSGIYLLL
ncbi:MAG: cytochrome C oxidase subunit IV family protein [Mycobacterium sp.]